MDEKQFQALVEKVGTEAASKIKSEMDSYSKSIEKIIEGKASAEDVTSLKTQMEQAVNQVKEICAKQGTTLEEISKKLDGTDDVKVKSIAQVLKEDEEDLRNVFKTRTTKEYQLRVNSKGQMVMTPYDSTKAAGPHATIADVGGAGNVAAIASSIAASTILRMGADSPIVSGFRNTPWVFALCNLINAAPGQSHYVWMDETTPEGASATVAEGGTKPAVQYKYTLRSSEYKKEACLVGFSQEFTMDFSRLQDEILRVASTDLINRVNSAILPNIKSAATAYTSGDAASYIDGDAITDMNDWHVLAALAAKVENSTFAPLANSAVMSTNKKYRLGTQQDMEGQWLDMPQLLQGMSMVSNPAMAAGEIMVGDFKQYNIALRGGLIIRVGFNGNDFANNMFSTVVEQFYFDYISEVRKAALVKGATFSDVKALLAAAVS